MIDGELFDKIEELGPKQVSAVLLLDKAKHECANASLDNFNLIPVCKTFVLQREDHLKFCSLKEVIRQFKYRRISRCIYDTRAHSE